MLKHSAVTIGLPLVNAFGQLSRECSPEEVSQWMIKRGVHPFLHQRRESLHFFFTQLIFHMNIDFRCREGVFDDDWWGLGLFWWFLCFWLWESTSYFTFLSSLPSDSIFLLQHSLWNPSLRLFLIDLSQFLKKKSFISASVLYTDNIIIGQALSRQHSNTNITHQCFHFPIPLFPNPPSGPTPTSTSTTTTTTPWPPLREVSSILQAIS